MKQWTIIRDIAWGLVQLGPILLMILASFHIWKATTGEFTNPAHVALALFYCLVAIFFLIALPEDGF